MPTDRRRVYICGPLTRGNRMLNVKNAIDVMRDLVREGFAPLCPHLSHFADPDDSLGHDAWVSVDCAWITAADVVIVLPGDCGGCEAEIKTARDAGIPCVPLADWALWNAVAE